MRLICQNRLRFAFRTVEAVSMQYVLSQYKWYPVQANPDFGVLNWPSSAFSFGPPG
jgi:hypothetical protein